MVVEVNSKRIVVPDLAVTKSASKFSDIGNRHSTVSYEFSVPLNAILVEGMTYATALGSDFSPINEKQDCILYSDTGKLIDIGFVRLISVDRIKREAIIRFFSGNVEWFSLLDNKLIGELDFSDLDHEWTEAGVIAGLSNTVEDGYVYHFTDYGNMTFREDTVVEVTEMFPSIFQKEIVERIFESIGYDIDGSFLEEPIYKRTVLPFTQKNAVRSPNQEATLVPGYMETETFRENAVLGSLGVGESSRGFDPDFVDTNDPVQFNIGTDQWINTNPGGSFYSFRLITEGEATYIVGGGLAQPGNNTINLRATVYNADTLAPIQSKDLHAEQSFSGNTNLTVTLNFNDVFGFTSFPGTKFLIKVVLTVDMVDIGSQFQYDIDITTFRIEGNLTESDELLEGDDFVIAPNLPKITQRDFIKDMIIRHGLVVQKSPNTKQVKFEPFRNVFRNIKNAVDWSEKVLEGEVKNIDYVEPVQAYGRNSLFRYREEDEDFWVSEYNNNQSRNFGDGVISIPNQFLPVEKEIYTSIFSPTRVISSFNGQVKLPYIPRYDYTGEKRQANPRLLVVSDNILIGDYANIDGGDAFLVGGAGGTSTFYAPFAWFYRRKDDLETTSDWYTSNLNLAYDEPQIPFNVDLPLLDEWYTEIQRTLARPALVELSIRLREYEFNALDFIVPVRIQSSGINGIFAIDSIEEYTGFEKPCIARLIQIG